jgi:AbrB family transcriptional regulator, transcriptional pleiotropic regulator of transition state genes
MKSTGIVRKVDSLGRIVLPIELRRVLGIEIKDPIEIFVDEGQIILKKYQPACMFCDNATDITTFKDKKICKPCLEELAGKL